MKTLLPTFIIQVAFIILTCSLSCKRNIEIGLPPHHKRIVLHGYIALGDTIKVTVSQTVRDKRSRNEALLPDALVLLYENNVLKDTLTFDKHELKFISPHVVAGIGKKYTVKVQAAGFPSVESTTEAVTFPDTGSLRYIKGARRFIDGDWMDDVKYSIYDPAQIKNFYLTAVYRYFGSDVGCVYSSDPAIERAQASILPFDESDCINGDEIIYSDQSFNGDLKEITLSVNSKLLETWTDINTGKVYRPYLKRYAISEDYYRYFKYITSINEGGDEYPLFNELSPVKGNVTNGYGLFAIFSLVTDTIR